MSERQHIRALDEDGSPLCLPMSGLFADLEAGRGALQLPHEFHAVPLALQLDVLQDWLNGLQAQRRAVLRTLFGQIASGLPGGNPDLQAALAAFRATCAEMGVAVPESLWGELASEPAAGHG